MKQTTQIQVGNVPIGGGAPVSVQSMCDTDTRDVASTSLQISALARAGCEIIRVAVPDMEAAEALGPICKNSPIPVVADIHFDHRLALQAAQAGVAKIRINPGNMVGIEAVKEVTIACKQRGIPIRIGVNAGSVPPAKRAGMTLPEAMVKLALEEEKTLNDLDFSDVCISVKASSVQATIECYQLLSSQTRAPLHLGVTEAGTAYTGLVKSSIGIGSLLSQGIGDTIRVSLTADPLEEVKAGFAILHALELRKQGLNLISCPTCGRRMMDVKILAQEVEAALSDIQSPITVAVMGCVVNGPGEARDADCGIAGSLQGGVLFQKGQITQRNIPPDELLPSLLRAVRSQIKA
jgi:(E)-4-hydroxy-3-methylbut-2-enyl-diphosphate synthase